MANNNFTKVIGSTERALKALLDRVLGATSTPFEWWTTLVLLNKGESTADEICGQLLRGHVVRSVEKAGEILAEMQRAGLVSAPDGNRYRLTDEGTSRFENISTQVQEIMGQVLRDVEEPEMAIVEKVLNAVQGRANQLLGGAVAQR